MAGDSDAQRIKRLKALCDHVDALRQQAEEVCKEVTAEIRRSTLKPDRRRKRAKVTHDRRKTRRR